MPLKRKPTPQPAFVSAGLIEVGVDLDGETWEGRVDFVDTCHVDCGAMTCAAKVARDGEEPQSYGNSLEIAWTVPPGGDPIVDGTLMVQGDASLRVRLALLTLSAAVRAAALARVARQAA